tara:strand:+ start:1231 stop:1875 length:645 start_codon:yes stop_codon:yes gene_type:complete
MPWKCSYDNPEIDGKVRVLPKEMARGCDTLDYVNNNVKKPHLKGIESLKISNVCKTDKSVKMDGQLSSLPHNSCIYDVTIEGKEKPAPPFQETLPHGFAHPPNECCLAPTCSVERQRRFNEDWKNGYAKLPECKAKRISENTTQRRDYFFSQTQPSQLVNNHGLKWGQRIAQSAQPNDKNIKELKQLKSCTKQSLLLRGACSDENCSEWMLNEN